MSEADHPMNGGDGTYSYAQNSSIQRRGADDAKTMILEAIAEKLDVQLLSATSSSFRLADFGCSVGPNTFITMANVVEAVQSKFIAQGLAPQIPEFQVLFNDHTSNDFNTLFASLPPKRPYLFAAGVPGSFYGRLFPRSSLHFAHSAFTLLWLSKVPEEVVDKSSPAWNRARIHYATASDEVADAYAAQFGKDVGSFLDARAQEIVPGGLMALILPAVRNGTHRSCSTLAVFFDLLGSALVDMANQKLISEDQIDSFNMPIYVPSLGEMEEMVERNNCFIVEKMDLASSIDSTVNPRIITMHFRAAYEGLVSKHFGSIIIDYLFNRFLEKLQEYFHKLGSSFNDETQILCLVLQHK